MIRRRVAPDGACLFNSIHLLTSVDEDENANTAQLLREHCAQAIGEDAGAYIITIRIHNSTYVQIHFVSTYIDGNLCLCRVCATGHLEIEYALNMLLFPILPHIPNSH